MLSRQEMIDILDEIARGTNAAARIAAIKQLREMADEEGRQSGGEFADLDELDRRRQYKVKSG